MNEAAKERRVDAGAIFTLAAKVDALVATIDRDRQDRLKEHQEDRENRLRERREDRDHLREWRDSHELRHTDLERRMAEQEALVLQPPDGLAHQVAAATAHRHSMRFWLRAIGSSAIGTLVTSLIGLWFYLSNIGGK